MMTRFIYTLSLYLLIPFVLLRLLWRSIRLPAYRQRWRERFGFFPALPCAPRLWIHAVSVGEVQAAIPLIQALYQQYPKQPILVTTTTPTGAQRVQTIFADQVKHLYFPYDLPSVVERFLTRTHPKLLILIETELWPNLLDRCQQRAIPVILANARLSARSATGYQRWQNLTKDMLKKLSAIATQTSADAERFLTLGAEPTKVQIMGNLKFELALPTNLLAEAHALRRVWGSERPVWIAASTHQGEETLILEAFQAVKQVINHLLLVLIPRHPNRFDQVATLCYQQQCLTARRSQNERCSAETEIYLGDTLGELLLLYASSDIAFVGGSLVPIGGHNLLEPAVVGLPIITGQHTFNFTRITEQLLEVDAVWQIIHPDQLATALITLFHDEPRRQLMGQRARELVARNRGALERLLTLVSSTL